MPTSLPVLDTNLEERVTQFTTPPPSPVRTFDDVMADLLEDPSADPRFPKTPTNIQGRFTEWEPGMSHSNARVAMVDKREEFSLPPIFAELPGSGIDVRELEEEYKSFMGTSETPADEE
uniref:Uncharacterized protein n=1 Tax=Karlodinium veneficum TaxID=407301 RepID=A7WPV5_KARVE|nr:unknown [Karlodinium veneficum]|mmetsp:Transcript_46057/g.72791  ORF Transcript_46057/g.72791 Transcript_46057/m.72791 type:complete len:119 (-) Transcript_46057:25-381(-)|eukprot:CAMPEP_0169147682 /NCGR_PEP_ID=MMETSP1015-20121227/48384_1 /TAXON_ID=342587 /ORGANISM="Karlodinium micrum, Strain CCMP2283" /LENGTH=118 /DNA_ID=CAMNT_0009215973 /DNA_START=62 /DNA_END=418 /DNA_ORIENTATION=+